MICLLSQSANVRNMLGKVVFFGALAFCCMNVNSLSLDKIDASVSSSSEQKKILEAMESLKEFVSLVDKYNLNVSVIGSFKKYGSSGWIKESVSLTMHMPTNDEFVTQATLDDAKQDSFLKKMETVGHKEQVGAKTRVIKIQNGQDEVASVEVVHPQYLIDSPSYEYLTNYENGVAGFVVPQNETREVLYNYIISNTKTSKDNIKNVQVITANVVLNEIEVSKDFPVDAAAEIKKVLPRFWMAIDDDTIIARLLVEHLDNKFQGKFQALIGVEHFALGGKPYANFEVADTNVLVFKLK